MECCLYIVKEDAIKWIDGLEDMVDLVNNTTPHSSLSKVRPLRAIWKKTFKKYTGADFKQYFAGNIEDFRVGKISTTGHGTKILHAEEKHVWFNLPVGFNIKHLYGHDTKHMTVYYQKDLTPSGIDDVDVEIIHSHDNMKKLEVYKKREDWRVKKGVQPGSFVRILNRRTKLGHPSMEKKSKRDVWSSEVYKVKMR